MPRTRSIKPEFWTDEKIGSISIQSRLLFIGMWTYSDDYGVCKASPQLLKSEIFPYDEDLRAKQVAEWCDALVNARMIHPFEYNGERLYVIRTFRSHQKVERPSAQRFCPEEILNAQLEIIDRLMSNRTASGDDSETTHRILAEDSPNTHRIIATETETETETETCTRRRAHESGSDKPSPQKRPSKLPDEEWLSELRNDPAYRGIDIGIALRRARNWCAENNRICSRRFFINWLNREKPVSTSHTQASFSDDDNETYATEEQIRLTYPEENP